MPDKYANFGQLAADPANVFGQDYTYAGTDRHSKLVVVAPHGGGIEPGTSELATAIAGDDHSLYLFEGLKATGNFDAFHITSTVFDAPGCRPLIQRAGSALVIHGEDSQAPAVFVGGRDQALGAALTAALRHAGFAAGPHPDPGLQGTDPANICNLGLGGAGAQLELSHGLRRLCFASLKRQGRLQRTPVFQGFVAAVRSCL